MPKIFISYRREDSQNITDRIYDHLKRNYAVGEVFKDVNSIPVGKDYQKNITESITASEVVLFIIGKDWAKIFFNRNPEDDWVRKEILEAKTQNRTIIPVYVAGITGLSKDELPNDLKFIAPLNGMVVRPDPDFNNDIQKLIGIINSNLTTKKIYKPEIQKQPIINVKVLAGVVALVILCFIAWWWVTRETCDYPKKGILIANSMNKEHDGFANSLVTNIDNVLSDSIYDVRPVGAQTREIKNYSEVIEKEHFNSHCQPEGIFVNGFIDKEDQVFNLYANIVKMEIKYPELITDNAIYLSNPESVEFSIREDAKFVSEFILAIIAMYEGNAQDALKSLGKLQANEKINLNDPEFLATVAFYKGNCYAIRGDEKKAKAEYKKAKSSSNPKVVTYAIRNERSADSISIKYQADPVYAEIRQKNIKENAVIENDLLKLLGKGLNNFEKNVLKQIFK